VTVDTAGRGGMGCELCAAGSTGGVEFFSVMVLLSFWFVIK
jgi:hypothetical protein